MSGATATVVPWLPLIVALLGLAGGAVMYQWQRSLDRKNEILRERRELYRKFVAAISTIEVQSMLQSQDDLRSAIYKYEALLAEMLIAAPDHVVAALDRLDETIPTLPATAFGDRPDDLPNALSKFREIKAAAVSEMRKDTFEATEISVEATFDLLRGPSVVLTRKK